MVFLIQNHGSSLLQNNIKQLALIRFNRKQLFEPRKVILFLHNAACHLTSMMDSFLQIKIIFILKYTTSILQPLDTEIVQNFNAKCRKRMVKYVLARINENSSTVQIIKDVDISPSRHLRAQS